MPRGDLMQTDKPILHVTEVAPPERAQHDAIILESIWISQQSIRARAKVKNPLQLDKLYRRKAKTGERALPFNAYIAGLRLAWLYGEAGMHQRTITRYDEARVRGDYQNSIARAGDSYHHWHKAMQLVTPWAAEEVFEVCCMDNRPGGTVAMAFLRRGLLYLFDRKHDWWGGTVDDGDLLADEH